ncbi:long-chain-fatty-acid--CoA ligase [Nisaea acidiphila]|uniref:3-methylmercaptopropionyl-CoA ligase n=1 Tax=Nisaea acidiphila TaxID=1862145 RepID=A0A9J7AWV3_9PROT|nr:long-chain-fatty-acid--CoA ligase [Nisaea acidiphila]UUX51274.1 long-chain-fatty-acid--CoA ligase [Nisaea acidiphila]
MLPGNMMDRPLTVPSILDFAAEIHGDASVVSARVEGDVHRYTYANAHRRVSRLAHALQALGIKDGDRVATLAWNGYRHFELYYAISGIGAVCHTINPRLFEDQIIYIVGHAADRILFLETSFLPLVEKLADRLPKDLRYVVLCAREDLPETDLDVLVYEELLSGQPDTIAWPELDERQASGLCYTSGTTGNPKGVLYSHRSTLIHTMGLLAVAEKIGLRPERSLLPVVPLFHVNAWGLPFAAPLVGTTFVLPGARLDGPGLFAFMDQEKVNTSWGVPTVWFGLLAEMRKQGRKPEGFENVLIGGSAAPKPMIEEFERDFGVNVIHGWGMTEMSPVGSVGVFKARHRALPEAERMHLKTAQGRRMFGVEFKIVDAAGARLPHDGVAFGELHVRGPAIMSAYFNDEDASEGAFDEEGWLKTGDVARIDPEGFLFLVDRTKDVIKSGGEWISSIDLESAALAHPDIAECAVIAVSHPKWSERPLLVAVLKDGARMSAAEMKDFLADKVAKLWLPDDVVFVDELPHTATGKLSKRELREQFKDYVLPGC